MEEDGAKWQIRVKVYNGNDSAPSWSFVDGNAVTGLNKNTGMNGNYPKLVTFNGKLYLTWYESDGTATQIRAAVYNGNDSAPSWSFVDGNASTGLNKSAIRTAGLPQWGVYNEKLYLFWYETDGTAYQIRAAVYNGNDSAPSWSFIDGNGATGLNKDVTRSSSWPSPLSFNGKLYLTWRETDGTATQIRVKVYNGNDSSPSWTFVDGNASTGINKSTSQNATHPLPVVFKNRMYILWGEIEATSGKYQARVGLYNGNDTSPEWGLVDGNLATGLNRDTSVNIYLGSIVAFQNKLYASWYERGYFYDPGGDNDQIRVIVANPD